MIMSTPTTNLLTDRKRNCRMDYRLDVDGARMGVVGTRLKTLLNGYPVASMALTWYAGDSKSGCLTWPLCKTRSRTQCALVATDREKGVAAQAAT